MGLKFLKLNRAGIWARVSLNDCVIGCVLSPQRNVIHGLIYYHLQFKNRLILSFAFSISRDFHNAVRHGWVLLTVPCSGPYCLHLLRPRGLTFTWWACCSLCQRHKPTEFTPSFFFNSICVSVSVFMTLSTVFHSINSPANSPLSHSVLSVLILP